MRKSDKPKAHNFNSDPLLNMDEAAAYLSICPSSMYALAEKEQLPLVFVTTDKKIRKSVLDELITRRQEPWRWFLLETQHN